MSDDKDNPSGRPTPLPPIPGNKAKGHGQRSEARDHASELDFESDALLDSLLSDPFPGVGGFDPATSSPKLHEPRERHYPHDEVTVVGQELEELLAAAAADSILPAARPTAPAPPPALGDITVVGRGLEELLARSAALESIPPPVQKPAPKPMKQPGVPPRLAAPPPPPRPGAGPAPRPRSATPIVPPGLNRQTPKAPAATGSPYDPTDDEDTRILRVSSELLEYLEPTIKLPPTGRPAAPGAENERSLEPESFVPPAAFVPESMTPGPRGYDAPTPMPPHQGDVPLAPRVPIWRSPNIEQPSETASVERPRPEPDVSESNAGAPAQATQPTAIAKKGPPIPREAWIARAEWLESEAHAASDPQAKGRALLVASELWALAGDTARAREVASEAAAVARSMTMAGRQSRWLAAVDRDYASVAATLEAEARGAATAEARAHAAYYAAEVQRVALHDAAGARKKFESAARGQSPDARALLMKLCEQLASSGTPPKLKWPENQELEAIARATDQLCESRSSSAASAPTPLGAFEDARRGFSLGDRSHAAHALLRLADVDGLGAPARWLAASLLAHEEQTRAEAVPLLTSLLGGADAASARRALAARRLELGELAALDPAFTDDAGAFSAADRLALALLSGADLAPARELVNELAAKDEGRALAAAATLLAYEPASGEAGSGTAASRSALALGRSLAQCKSGDLTSVYPALAAFDEAHGQTALRRALTLESAVIERSPSRVAAELSQWSRPDHDTSAARDKELVSGVILEIAGDASAARSCYERALAADPACEPAARALLKGLEPARAAELLEQLAEAESSGTQAALHFVEAAVQRGIDDAATFHGVLEKAVEADPKLVLPYRLGEHLSRQKGDAERLLGWLRARRPITHDRLELALDLVREALLVAETDLDASAALLREASETLPNDLAITELYERVAPELETSRAPLREAAAHRSTGAARRRLLLEAAQEYERAQDREGTIRCARGLVEAGGGELSGILFARAVLGTPHSTELSERLLAQAKSTDDVVEQRELYERLSEIDAARGNTSSALLWQNAITERSPRYLPSLRRLEQAYLDSDRRDDLEQVMSALSEALPGADATAAARIGARLRITAGNWAGSRRYAEIAVRVDPNALWALRLLSSQARAANEAETLLGVERRLYDLATRSLDKATLALRGAEAAVRLSRWDDAQALLERGLDQVPDHQVLLQRLAEVLEERDDYAGAARAYEAVAEASRLEAHKVEAWVRAATLWLDRADNADRGRIALETAVALDLGHEEAVTRLQGIYVARGDRQRLAELLQQRLERTTDPEERIAIEVARGRALAEIGEPAAAKAALAAALDTNPDHLEALEAFAGLCLAEGDWTGAEQAFIRIARHGSAPERQAQSYRRLGELYDGSLPNPERAELAYQEVLKREPDDTATVDRLIAVYERLGAAEKAVQLSTELLDRATSIEERRERTIRLATVLERIAKDKKQAEALLDKARREWPHDASVLRALVELHTRNGEARAGQVLLDRAASDARRALGTGRFDASLFETLAAVADLKGSPDGAAVAHATLAALAGDELSVRGAGTTAGEARVDELLAPDLLSPPLRSLLVKVGSALDAAYPFDVRSIRATPLPADSSHRAEAREVAAAFGLGDVELLVSPGLGPVCVPAGSAPPTLVYGQALLDASDSAARRFLLIRALKIVQARAGALARTAPIDLWPMVAGLLGNFAPSFTPQGVDGKKLADARSRIQSKLPSTADNEVVNLALEVTGSIGNRASQLGTVVHQWGNRCALLAVGEPLPALRALAFASGSVGGPPALGPDRSRWIVRNAEARDVMIYSVSEQYAEARRRLGVAIT